jgi:altronate hydrolase
MTNIDLSEKGIIGPVIRLHHGDNVVVARIDVAAGTPVPEEGLVTGSDVQAGYKIAAAPIRKGEPVLKYNVVIGFASEDIPLGALVHTHNVEFREYDRDYAFCRDYRPVDLLPEDNRATFQGFIRPDGRVGTRNYVAVVSTVNCSATVVRRIADWFTTDRLAGFPMVDGVIGITHGLGCAMEMTGEPMSLLRRTLAGYMRNPNVAAAVLVGLGCERNQMDDLMAAEGLAPGPRLKTLVMQQAGGTRASIEAGIGMVGDLLPEADTAVRQTVSAAHLMVGLQCGGSDGFSSITANPALGRAMDILVRNGGTAILSETPEIYGVEHTLTQRAATRDVGEKLIERIRWWKEEYGPGRDIQIHGKITQGNVAGGLANILEKSLGSSMKGGTTPLMAVYHYAQQVTANGLVFMDSPGFDPVSATGQVAGGANLIAFTTGRGSCFGAKPAPSVKLATNTQMYRRLEEDMDLNCGEIADGLDTIDGAGQRIFDLLLRVASGERTKSELLGLGDNEFVPWQIGILS